METTNVIAEQDEATNNEYLDKDGGIKSHLVKNRLSHHLEMSYEPTEEFRKDLGPVGPSPQQTRIVHFTKRRSTFAFDDVLIRVGTVFYDAQREVEFDKSNPHGLEQLQKINICARLKFQQRFDVIEPTFMQFALKFMSLRFDIHHNEFGNSFDDDGDDTSNDECRVSYTFAIETNSPLDLIRSTCSDMFEAGNITEYGGPPYDLNNAEDQHKLFLYDFSQSGDRIDGEFEN